MEVVCYLVSIDEASDVYIDSMCVCTGRQIYIMDGTTTTTNQTPSIY